MSNNELTKAGQTSPAPMEDQTDIIQAIMALAKDDTFDAEKMAVLVSMKNDHEDREAKRAFNSALVEFHKNPPTIVKNAHVNFKTSKGTTDYKHATIDSVLKQLRQPLYDIGLAVRWRIEPIDNKIRVTCVLSHVDGYSEESTLEGVPDTSGGKNATQGNGSTVTYLKRYTLLSVLGLAEQGEDNDAILEAVKQNIDESQINQLEQLIEETETELPRFCKAFNVGSLQELNHSQFGLAVKQLNAKKGN